MPDVPSGATATTGWRAARPSPAVPLDIPHDGIPPSWLDRSPIDLLAEIAARQPGTIAVDDGMQRFTHAELHAMACRLAAAIQRAGLPPGPIGVLLPDDALHPVGLLGCLAAGRIVMPLDRDSPATLTATRIAAAGLAGLVVPEADLRQPAADALPRIAIEAALGDGPTATPTPPAPDAPAFILPTSGSTGAPKAIVRSQRILMARIGPRVALPCINRADRVISIGPPWTGMALTSRMSVLLAGAELHILDLPRLGLAGLAARMRAARITMLRIPPAVLRAIAALPEARAICADLRMLWCGGDVLLQADLAAIRRVLLPGCGLIQSLHMTEVAIAAWIVPPEDNHDPVRVAAGYILPGIEYRLLDEAGAPLPPGEAGELEIRAAAAALGDWVDGRLVTARFTADPDHPGLRIFRTGDVVEVYPDGAIVVLGRRDRMIKIRGMRVEPAVIELAMRDVPGVADAAVVALRDGEEVRLHGFVLPGPNPDPALLTAVRARLRAALPAWMHPAALHLADTLPLLPTGKLDTSRLIAHARALEQAPPPEAPPSPPPQHPAPGAAGLARMRAAWRSVLGPRAAATAETDASLAFDAAGGDSLRMLQLIFVLEQATGLTLSTDRFRLDMTRAEMAAALAALHAPPPPAGEGAVFLFPGVGGDEPRLVRLRAACAPALRLTPLGYGPWTDYLRPGFDMAAVVASLADTVAALAPSGPIRLAGYSLGGQVAWAVGAALAARGRQIGAILLLDSAAPDSDRGDIAAMPARPIAQQPAPRGLPAELRQLRAAIRQGDGDLALAHMAVRRLLGPRGAPLLRALARHHRRLPHWLAFPLGFHLTRSLLSARTQPWRDALAAGPRPPLPLVLLRARMNPHPVPDMGWAGWSPHLSVTVVEGDHFTMLDPPLAEGLAQATRDGLAAPPCPVAAVPAPAAGR